MTDLRRSPDAQVSRAQVALLAMLGYGVLLTAIVALVGIAALILILANGSSPLVLKLLVPLGGFALVIARAFWVRIPTPDGLPVSRADAPQLFELMDRMRHVTKGPRIHRVLIDDQLNASIQQIPRIGPFAWQRNYLVVGLPLMSALAPQEFAAVLAHEYGHLSGKDGRFSVWIYRVRATWARVLQALEESPRFGSGLFRRFFSWYAPLFDSRSFALARAHEFTADAVAAEATSASAMGRALMRLSVADAHLSETVWPAVSRLALTESTPPTDVFARMREQLPSAAASAATPRWIRRALREESSPYDTHPPMPTRLAALDLDPGATATDLENRLTETAADIYLGSLGTALAERLGADWAGVVAEGWRAQRSEYGELSERLVDLDGQEKRTADEDAERGRIRMALFDQAGGMAAFHEALATDADNASAHYGLGVALLARGDESGLEHLERAMDRDADAIVPGCDEAVVFLLDRDRVDEAARFTARADAHWAVLTEAQAERENVSVEDRLEVADLPAQVRDVVVSRLSTFTELRAAYLVRKRVAHFDEERPVFFLFIEPRNPFRQGFRDADDERPPLGDQVASVLPDRLDVGVVVIGASGPLRDVVVAIEGSKIYPGT